MKVPKPNNNTKLLLKIITTTYLLKTDSLKEKKFIYNGKENIRTQQMCVLIFTPFHQKYEVAK